MKNWKCGFRKCGMKTALASKYGSPEAAEVLRHRVPGSNRRAVSSRSDGEGGGQLHSGNNIALERARVKPGEFAADRSEKRKAPGGSARRLGRANCPVLARVRK